jgi:predicted permease
MRTSTQWDGGAIAGRLPGGLRYWMETVFQDVRFASRLLVRSPGLVVSAVACLAIGIGITTAIYGIMQSLVFRDLPGVTHSSGLVKIQALMPYGNWEELRKPGGPFSALAAYRAPVPFVLAQPDGRQDRIWGQLATPDYFAVLGVRPAAGRLFGPAEERDGEGHVAVISYRMWQTRFGGEPSIVGRTIRVNGRSVTVAGVAAPGFLGASPMLSASDLWLPTTAPAALAPELAGMRTRRAPEFELIGRLRPGVQPEQAETALEAAVRRLEEVHGDANRDRKERRVILLPGGRLYPIRDEDLPKAMGLPFMLVGLILLMACGNVANMLIARGAVRQREIAVRIATGAGRGRIVRQLLTESVMLSAAGGAAGLALAEWIVQRYRAMSSMFPSFTEFPMSLDWRALVFSAVLTTVCGLLFGLAPALESTRQAVAVGLKPDSGVRPRALRWLSLRNILVANQVAASVVLLMITGFIVVGFGSSANGELGFNYRNLYLFNVDPVRDGYDAARAAAYFERLPQRLAAVPGVSSVSVAETLPVAFTGTEAVISAKVDLFAGPRSAGTIHADRVGAGFFETVGLEVLRGRGFQQRDIASARAWMVGQRDARQASLAWGRSDRPDAGIRRQHIPGRRRGARRPFASSFGRTAAWGVPAGDAGPLGRGVAARNHRADPRASRARRYGKAAGGTARLRPQCDGLLSPPDGGRRG